MIKKNISVLILVSFLSQLAAAEPASVSSQPVYSPADIQSQAIASFKAGQFAKAAEFYRALSVLQPNNADLLKDLMWSYWNGGNPADTIEVGNRILAMIPGDVETQNLLGKAYQSTGERKKAVESFKKAAGHSPDNVALRLSLANALIQDGNVADAESILHGLEKEVPNNPSLKQKLVRVWKTIARSYVVGDKQSRAIETYQHVLGGNGKNLQVQIAMARLQVEEKKYDQAQKTLRKVLAESPDTRSILPKLATVQSLKGDYHAAVDTWRRVVASFPEKSDYKFKYAQALYFDGQYNAAVRNMDDLVQNPDVGRKAADFLFDDAYARGDYAGAAKLMEENLSSWDHKVDDQRRLVRLAETYEKLENFPKSLDIVNQALEYYPDDAAALTFKASLLMESKKYRDAIAFINGILEKSPGSSGFLFALADAYESIGDRKNYLRTIELFRKQDPTNPYLYLREAEAMFSIGRRDQAKRSLVEWLKENGESQVLPIFLYHGLTRFKRDGMLAHTQHHTTAQFESHMRALHDHAFTPITVADVDAWLSKGTALPSRPVLITFDDGRLDGFTNADPILDRFDMKATMFVIGQNADRNLPNYASWKELRKFKATGRWDLQAHTDQGHSYVPITKDGYKGLFLISRKWIGSANRLETRQELIDRINEDHANCRRKMKRELDVDAKGFAFPEGNFGQNDVPNTKYSSDINLSLVRNFFAVSFYQDRNGLNVRSRDPYMLNRIEPPQNWSGEDLFRHIADSNPANRVRLTLFRWALWQSHITEARYWLEQLKVNGASNYLLAAEQARLNASFGNIVSAKKFQQQAQTALGKSAVVSSRELDPVQQERLPVYNAAAKYFGDNDHRQNLTFDHGFTSGNYGNVKFSALQRLGSYRENGVPNITENGLGAGVRASLGLRHSINVEAMQHLFNGEAHNFFSPKAEIASRWGDFFRTELSVAREALPYARALNENIRMNTANVVAAFEAGETWDALVEATGSKLSDENQRWVGQLYASRALSGAGTPRLIGRFYRMSNKHRSPFYYSPDMLTEGNLGLVQSFRILNPYTLTLTYLPGLGQESGERGRFVQNFKSVLDCRWIGSTTVKIEFNYSQNPTYNSRGANVSLEHRFGSSLSPSKAAPKGRIAAPESPQPDMSDAVSF